MAELNATAASLLGFLHAGPMTGWDLLATAQQRIGGFWSLTRSQVYRELTAMAAAGLVEAGAREKRDRQPFAITPAGREAFAAWVRTQPSGETIRFPLLLTVAFGDHLDRATLDALLADQRGYHERRHADYLARRDEVAPFADRWSLATLDFGIRHEQAILDWFAALPDLLPPTPGG